MKAKVDQKRFTATIVGGGRVGKYHIKGQVKLGSRVIVYETSKPRVIELKKDFPQIIIANSLDEAIAKADVVHICTPPMYHLQSALLSISHKKPTIIEKPLTFKLEEAITIYKAALKTATPVILATSFRIGPAPLQIYKGIRDGKIGELTSIETTYVHDTKNLETGHTWRKQLEDTAFLYEGGSHAVDLNMWLADQPVAEVQCMVSTKKTRAEYRWIEDFAINLKYSDGLTGRVWVSPSSPLSRHGSNIAAYGSSGAYRDHSKEAYYQSYSEGDDDWATHQIDVSLTMLTMQSMSEVFNSFVQGKRKNFKPLPDIEDGLKLMIVLNTIEKAINNGKTEVVPSLEDTLATSAPLYTSIESTL